MATTRSSHSTDDEPITSPAAPATEVEGLAIGGALRALAVVGPPITIATGLLFYFGWALTAEQSRAIGVDESIFAMSTRDYVLRSLSALFVPLIVGAGVLMAWVVVHGWVLAALRNGRYRAEIRRAGTALAWTAWWVIPLLAGLLSVAWPAWRELAVPLSLAAGILVAEYGARLRRLAAPATASAPSEDPAWLGHLRTVLIGVLVTAALFWEVANFAGVVGRGKAEAVVESVAGFPEVSVYSRSDLHLQPPGVTASVYDGVEDDYRFVYTGLHLLQRTGDKYFLVPDGWRPGVSPLVVLRDDASMRLEFTGSR